MIPPISALDLVFAQGFELGYLSTIVIPSEQIRTFSLITAHDISIRGLWGFLNSD